ncbi:hypothetical protein M0R45_028930 [Rubus argutus]|uniref:Uncharacterized protein n=1 Tax=Rubus argutus TaxID=59490 RepID=A0AAW1W659_RUBAR
MPASSENLQQVRASPPSFMASIAPFSPSLTPNKSQADGLLTFSDPKFALHGEILLLVLVLLFATLFHRSRSLSLRKESVSSIWIYPLLRN